MVVEIICIVLCFMCIVFSASLAVVYNTFNQNVKQWSMSIDDSARAAINLQARKILEELDEKISKNNELNELEDEEVAEISDSGAE